MKRHYLLLLTILLISINTLFATTSNRSILLNVDIAETGPVFSMYKGESSNSVITGVSPTSENTSRDLSTDSLLIDNPANTSFLKYYFFVGSNFSQNRNLNVSISSDGFTNPNTSTTVPIITEIIAPTNNAFTKTTNTFVLSNSSTQVISDYEIESGYYLDKYTSSNNASVPSADTYNASRAIPASNIYRELFFMEMAIGWNGESKLPAGSYSATIQIAYSVN